MTREIHKSVERSTKRGALMMGAVLVGGLIETARTVHEKRQPDIADVIGYHEDEGPSFVFVRGCGENYLAQAPLLHRKLGGYGSMLFEYQVQGRHSQEIIDQNIIKACKSDGDRDRVFMATSMGLMNLMNSLLNPAVRAAIGRDRLQAIVSLQGITSREDLQPDMQKAAEWAAQSPRLSSIGDVWRLQRLHAAQKNAHHGEHATDAETLIHLESSANMPPRLVFSQYETIHHSRPFADDSHQIVVDENPRMRLVQVVPEYDAVANRESTTTSLERSFTGLSVETITDEHRHHGDHANNIEYSEPLEELMMKFSGRDRSMALAARNLVHYSSGNGVAIAA